MRTMITAHSGSDSTPDNSLDFIKKAMDIGADALEIDVNRDRNNRLVLFHDQNPDDTRACATLEEAFDLAAKHRTVKIMCDLKKPGLEAEVLKQAEKNRITGRIILTGRLPEISYNREPFSCCEVFLNFEDLLETEGIDIFSIPAEDEKNFTEAVKLGAHKCMQYGVSVINTHYSLCTGPFFRIMENNGIRISAWTVDREEDIKRLLEKGIYNITTKTASRALFIRNSM